jgi:SAM-dependent methyltransferase
MLQALQEEGWEVLGLERTAREARQASEAAGVPVIAGDLASLPAVPPFRLIVLFQVLEHLPDPVAVIGHCRRLLSPGGWLILAVPNRESWQARFCRAEWLHLDVPRHLFHFSPRVLKEMLRRHGFETVRVSYQSWEHDPYGWVQSLLNRLRFSPNDLTRRSMGMEPKLKGASALLMGLVSLGLVPLSVVLAVGSWAAQAGAIVEVCARSV